MKDRITYWREISDYDLETAEAMLETKRYLYVGFMCHQAVEKIFKAYFIERCLENPPFTHNLPDLAIKGGFYEDFSEEQKDFIDQIEPLNIESRYPTHKEALLKRLTRTKCEELLKEKKNLQEWIKMQL